MFACVKVPKNLCEYRLFRGADDFGNLKQWGSSLSFIFSSHL